MRRLPWTMFCSLAALVLGCLPALGAADEGTLLWQIGKADNNTAELALGPKGYARFSADPLFVVGRSDPKQDWPYVQPGPGDAWAEGRPHDFSIVFTLKQKPAGACRLDVDLVDTHDRTPPKLVILVNQRQVAEHQTPKGGPDDTISGDASKGIEHRFSVDVPADALVPGTNDVTIRTATGSWVLYDWIGFRAPAGTELGPAPTATVVHAIRSAPALVERGGRHMQTIQIAVRHFGNPGKATVEVSGAAPVEIDLKQGSNTVDIPVAAVDKETPVAVEVKVGDKTIAAREVKLLPVRKWVIYLLPHSHVDIGYTELQTEGGAVPVAFLRTGDRGRPAHGRLPAGGPVQVERRGPLGHRQLPEAGVAREAAGVRRRGEEGLDRPGRPVRQRTDGAVPARGAGAPGRLRRPGLAAVRRAHRVGHDQRRAGLHLGTDHRAGRRRREVLLHRPQRRPPHRLHAQAVGRQGRSTGSRPRASSGCSAGFRAPATTAPSPRPSRSSTWCARTEASDYPYDLIQVRYCLGDNAGPGPQLSDMVKTWNAKYAYPKLVIATVPEMMLAFEKRYGKDLPEVRGDFTPYWEDGAGSSSRETGLNRAAAERLTQAEALWAILSPKTFPAADFYAAWRNAILYDEHTWGAYNSISQPDSDFAKGQWAIKQAFALEADRDSRKLLAAAVKPVSQAGAKVTTLLVFNTNNWPRTDLVVLPKTAQVAGDVVLGADGKPVPSQRLSTGQLAFLASGVPPLGAQPLHALCRASRPPRARQRRREPRSPARG